MPRMISALPELYDAIVRPVAFDLTREVGQVLHMPSVTQILFNGPANQANQSGSTLDYHGAPSKFPGGSQITVSLSETSNESNVFGENALQENAPVVSLDRDLGVRLRPIYASTQITLSFNIRCRGRVEADKIRNEFQMRSAMGRRVLLHTITYSYSIPDEQMDVLKQVHQMREAVAGYGEDFDTWMKKISTPRLGKLGDLLGNNGIDTFGEIQTQVQGVFDFEVSPEAPDKSDEDGQYNYPIEYKVRFDKVVGMSLDYPLVVHNQVMPKAFHGIKTGGGDTPQPYANSKIYSDRFNQALRELFLNKKLKPSPIDGVRYPVWDEWMPSAVAPNTSTVYVCMLQINPADLYDVIDLTDLPGVVIDGDVRQYMANQGNYLGVLNRSVVHVELYKNQGWMGDEAITVSSDLKVRTTEPMCLRDRYHLRISLVTDLFRLTDQARLEFRRMGRACQKILLTLQQQLFNGQYVPKLVGPGIVPDQYLLECASRINRYKGAYATGLEHVMLTVGNFLVSVHKASDNARDESGLGIPVPQDVSTDPNYQSQLPRDCEPCAGQSGH